MHFFSSMTKWKIIFFGWSTCFKRITDIERTELCFFFGVALDSTGYTRWQTTGLTQREQNLFSLIYIRVLTDTISASAPDTNTARGACFSSFGFREPHQTTYPPQLCCSSSTYNIYINIIYTDGKNRYSIFVHAIFPLLIYAKDTWRNRSVDEANGKKKKKSKTSSVRLAL